jgi:hypothetical protein
MTKKIDDGWDDIAKSMGIPVEKASTPCLEEGPLEGFVCTMIGMTYFEDDDEFVKVLGQYGGSREEIEKTVYGHMRECQPCRDAHEKMRQEYKTFRQSLAPKPPQPAPLSEGKRDSGTYALIDEGFVARRKSSIPPPHK